MRHCDPGSLLDLSDPDPRDFTVRLSDGSEYKDPVIPMLLEELPPVRQKIYHNMT